MLGFPNCLHPQCPAIGNGTSMCVSALGSAEATWEPGGTWCCFSLSQLGRADPSSQTVMLPLGAVLCEADPGCALRLAQCQAVGIVALVVACFPLGTRAFLLRLYKCRATDSFLPRKGKHDRYGVKFPQSCSTSSFRAAAWLPRSDSGSSPAVNFFSSLLAVRCPLPWLQGKPRGTLPVPSNGEWASSFHVLLLPVTGGSFAEGSNELLHLESVWARWSGGGKRRAPPCCGHQLPQWFCRPGMCPRGAPSRCGQPRLPGSEMQRHPQLVR